MRIPPSILLAELARRQATATAQPAGAVDLLADATPEQLACLNDDAKQVAVLGTRRSGKSRSWLRKMAEDAVTIPGCRQVYVNTTRPEAERIAWNGIKRADGLLGLNEIHQLGGKPNHAKLRMAFPRDSYIELFGADNERAIQKLVGGAYHRVWIDEAQKMPHIERFITEVLVPAMMDYGGQIVLSGTASRDLAGLFYEITRDDPPSHPNHISNSWNVHLFDVLDNPFFGKTRAERYAKTIGPALKATGLTEEAPEIQREWFGKWAKSDANFVYAVHQVAEHDLTYDGTLPTREDGTEYEWMYGLGVDIGYDPDPSAYVVWAWTWDLPELYEVESWKQGRLIPDEVAEIIQRLMGEYGFSFMVADAGGGGKQIVAGWEQGWQDRFPIPIEAAKKSQKATYIEFMNNDIRAGKLKLVRGSPLHEEMKRLTWLPQVGQQTRKEDKRNPNHCADAGLYAHRSATHHRYVEPEPEPEYGSDAYWAREEQRLEDEAIEELEDDNQDRRHFYGI